MADKEKNKDEKKKDDDCGCKDKKRDKKVKNEIDLDPEIKVDVVSEAPLTLQQRIQKGRTMRRNKVRLKIGRERAERKMASPEKLQIRARKAAIKIMRKKVAGPKGLKYADLSPAEKSMIDKKLEGRKKAVDRIARKLLPKIRKADRDKKSVVNKSKTQTEYMKFDDNSQLYEAMDYIAQREIQGPAFSYNSYLEEKVLEWGTKEMVDSYKKATPGQKSNKELMDKLKKHILSIAKKP